MTLYAVLGSLVVLLIVVVATVCCGVRGGIISGIFGCLWFSLGGAFVGVGRNHMTRGEAEPALRPVDQWPLASKKDRRGFVANLLYGQPQFPQNPARLVGISCIRIVVTDGIPRRPDGPLCAKPGSPTLPGGRQVWILMGEMHTNTISAQGVTADDINIQNLIKQIHAGFPQNAIDLYYEQPFSHPPAIVGPRQLTAEKIQDVTLPYGKDMSVTGYVSRFSYPCYALTAAAKESLNPPCWEFGKENNIRYTQIDPRGGSLVKKGSHGRPERVGQLLWDLGDAFAAQASDPHAFRLTAATVGRELWGSQEGKEGVLRNMPTARDILIQVARSAPETANMAYAALLSVSQQLDSLSAVRRQVDRLPLEVAVSLEKSVAARRDEGRQEHLANILNRHVAKLPPLQLALECIEAGRPNPAMDSWYQLFDDMFNIEVSPTVDLYVVARGLRCWCAEVDSWPQTFVLCIEGINHVFGQEEMLKQLGGRTVYSLGPTRNTFYPNITLTGAGVVA